MKTHQALPAGVLLALLFAAAVLAAEEPVASGPARSVIFAPQAPVAGRPVLFTARRFLTPGLLKWDMGDGTRLVSGGQAAPGEDATLSYTYALPGTFLVRVFDRGGSDPVPAATVTVEVSAVPREAPPPSVGPPRRDDKAADSPAGSDERKIQAQAPMARPAAIVEKPMATAAAVDPALPAPAAAPAPSRGKYAFIKIGPYGGWLQPRDAWIRKIYGDGEMLYGARMGLHLWKGFYLWLGASQARMIGSTTLTGEKTTLTLLPVSAFLRFHVRLGFIGPYVGAGYTYLAFQEDSAIGGSKGTGGNAAIEAGFELRINRRFLADLGARYDEIRVSPTGFEIDLGGLQAGIALLVSF